METTAEREGDGYVLRGRKRWVTNGTIAGVAVIWAKCEGEVRGFLVESGTPGFEVRPIHRKMSLRVSMSSEILLNDCRIPAANALPGASGLVSRVEVLERGAFRHHLGLAGRRHGQLRGRARLRRPSETSLAGLSPGSS